MKMNKKKTKKKYRMSFISQVKERIEKTIVVAVVIVIHNNIKTRRSLQLNHHHHHHHPKFSALLHRQQERKIYFHVFIISHPYSCASHRIRYEKEIEEEQKQFCSCRRYLSFFFALFIFSPPSMFVVSQLLTCLFVSDTFNIRNENDININ